MDIFSVLQSQQTVNELKHVHVLAKPVTFIRSMQAMELSKLCNNSTQTCSRLKDTVKAVKSHSTQTQFEDPISNKYPHIQNIIDNGMLFECLQQIDNSNQLNDFITVIESIACGNLPTSNIAWKCVLYRAKWAMCKITTTMKFNQEYIEFSALLQILFGTSITNVLCGPGHFGKVLDEKVHRNQYNPKSGKCNFAILSAYTLSKLDIGYPKDIPCGKIEHTLQIAEEQSWDGKQFTLSFDGKLVAQGSFGEKNRDVDLWGHEGVISVHQALKK